MAGERRREMMEERGGKGRKGEGESTPCVAVLLLDTNKALGLGVCDALFKFLGNKETKAFFKEREEPRTLKIINLVEKVDRRASRSIRRVKWT